MVSNPILRARLDKTIQSVHIDAGNLFGAVASEAAYTHGAEWHEQLIAYLEDNVELVRSFLSEKLPDIKLIKPEATYLLWLDFRALGLSQPDLVDLLIHKAGLGFNDGTAFGPDGIGFMRVNIGCPRSMLLDGLLRLENALTN